jgi:hypothetical protein
MADEKTILLLRAHEKRGRCRLNETWPPGSTLFKLSKHFGSGHLAAIYNVVFSLFGLPPNPFGTTSTCLIHSQQFLN